jgi:peptidoglycan/xylan/chitin deacetylase (PgdA/CDA1 family)
MSEFALCLTHDVDRPYKTYQSIYYALKERDPAHLAALRPGVNPYWQFESLMALEDELGVRSAFYFLNERGLAERSLRDWLRPRYWLEHLGRYDIETPRLAGIIEALDADGWEVGLHGSYDSYDDRERLQDEKSKIERVVGHDVRGGRQHFLNRAPETWDHHRAIGLNYDSSLGSSTEYGFRHGYDPIHPFNDEFVVFPLTVMEVALVNGTESIEAAWAECERLLAEAAANDAVMTVLWHPRYVGSDFPGYRWLYRRLIERALEMGAWVGPPGAYYDRLTDDSAIAEDGHGRTASDDVRTETW